MVDSERQAKDFNSIRTAYRDKRSRLGDAVCMGSCVCRPGIDSPIAAAPNATTATEHLHLQQQQQRRLQEATTKEGPINTSAIAVPVQRISVMSIREGVAMLTPTVRFPQALDSSDGCRRPSAESVGLAWQRNSGGLFGLAERRGDTAASSQLPASNGGSVSRTRVVQVRPVPRPTAAAEEPRTDAMQRREEMRSSNATKPSGGEAGAAVTEAEDLEAEPLSGLLYNSLAKADSARYADSEVEVEKMPAAGTPEASYTCSVRLKKIAKLVESDEISKEMLIKNLNYAVKVLESVYVDETRRLCNEDDDLPEVPPNEVPNEVRDWLASTFTRSQTSLKQSREKPRFRSVANAIRAGIMVERIYRRLSSSSNISVPPNVLILLKAGLDDWCFDIFELNEASDNHAMKFVGYELLHKYDLITKFKINTNVLENFLYKLEEGYSKWANPYHNLVHGADVAQTCHFIMSSSKLVNWLTDLEIFATIVAALVHDYEHTGTTNSFHVNTGSDLALLYNDKGVLENYHVSAVFRLLREEDYNILTGLSREEYKEFRALVIDMVLNTDMSLHFQQIKNMKQLLSMPENIDKEKALALMLHCADISHPGKRWNLHHRWTMSLLEEFFRQGDREKALDLPCSPLCDRSSTMVAQSQVGFIDFIMEPSFAVLGDMLEKILTPLFEQQKQLSKNPSEEAGARISRPVRKWHGDGGFCLPRPWNDIIKENRSQWKARAEIEEAEKAAKCAAEDASGGAAAAVATGGASAAGSRGAHKPPSEEHQQQQQQGASRPPLGTINEDKH
ncbi:hypothetical protein BOX15_Mlig011124g2 [Macrostomum lignano]|uniref:Phosphodiesterase n=1 Tax=Macrostomum lignano TaxID=282301 RepID=A0A267EIK0_9PLAT|nr:hypothetical protein BOX15_Mlig011124g2 [Macrostomum lignano]